MANPIPALVRSGLVERTSFFVDQGNGLAHLFVALTNEFDDGTGNGKRILVVNLTTDYKNRSTDTTCLVAPGEHISINRQSYVAYRYAELRPLQEFFNQKMEYRGTVTTEIYNRISAGIPISRHTPNKVIDFYNAYNVYRTQPRE